MADETNQDEGFEQFDGQNGGEENPEEEQTMESQDEDDNEDDRKLFVGGLSWETTAKELREYFEKYGEVTNCTLKTDLQTRQSRGFGFVVFASPDTVEKVLTEKEHKLNGRTIDPKRANPRPVLKKIFVGRLDPAVAQEEVKAYFEKFGAVEKMEMPFDKTKEQRRAFCFVEFKTVAGMKKVLEQEKHKIGSQEVDIKKATPPGGAMRGGPRGRGFPGPGGRGGRGRGGYGGYGGYNQGYGYGGYGYGGYDQGYGYGGYSYDQNYGYSGYGGGWGNGYDQGYGYGYGYDDWGYGQDGGGNQSSYGKAQGKRGGHGYHPYSR